MNFEEQIRERLFSLRDEKYRDFHSSLCPGIPKERIIGVRKPLLRALAKELIKSGAAIVTDTNMALSGINKKTLAAFGCEAKCLMADETVAKLAKEQKTTRAAVSMEIAASWNKPTIFVVGNAPTALMKLYEMYQAGLYKPAFIIGVPVGFVNVVEAKEEIMETDIPYIINKGRKGGSNVAAAICNAVLYELSGRKCV